MDNAADMPATRLILVKHAAPVVVPGVPASKWALDDAGRAKAAALADHLRPYLPADLVTSREPKAVMTGDEIGRALALDPRAGDDLFEHDRDGVPHMRSGEFISAVEQFFRRPDDLVLGDETATECADRFDAAVRREVDAATHPTLILVTHGTVIALLIARRTGQKPFPLWRQLGLPSLVVINLPAWNVEAVVERM